MAPDEHVVRRQLLVTVTFPPNTPNDWEPFRAVCSAVPSHLIEDQGSPCLVVVVDEVDEDSARAKLNEVFDVHGLQPISWEFTPCTIE